MIKKAMILLILLCALAGCAFPAPQVVGNTIRPLALTEREQDILDLVGAGGTEILLYEFDVSEPCTSFDIDVDVYKKGVLVEAGPGGGISQRSPDPQPWKGKLAITIDNVDMGENQSGVAWNFTIDHDEGGRASIQSEPWLLPEETSRAWGSLAEEMPLEIGKEVALYDLVISDSNSLSAYDSQEYVNNPEYIKKQDYLVLITCEFGNKPA
jgi:hypothetical protein